MDHAALTDELARARRDIEDLRLRLERAEINGGTRRVPDTMLLDESFLKRAFAVLGHYMIASIIVIAPIYIVIFIIALLVE